MKSNMSAMEFKKRYDVGDVLCRLAQTMAKESLGQDYMLYNKKPTTIQGFVNRAQDFIGSLEREHLQLIFKEEV